MSKGLYIGIGGAARKVKNIYIGVGGVARKVRKGYIGVNGAARQFYPGITVPSGYTHLDYIYNPNGAAITGKISNRLISGYDMDMDFSVIQGESVGGYICGHYYMNQIETSAQTSYGTNWGYILLSVSTDGFGFRIDSGGNRMCSTGSSSSGSSTYAATQKMAYGRHRLTTDIYNGKYTLDSTEYKMNGVTGTGAYGGCSNTATVFGADYKNYYKRNNTVITNLSNSAYQPANIRIHRMTFRFQPYAAAGWGLTARQVMYDLVPVRRNSDGKIGLIDLVDNTFYFSTKLSR